MTCGLHNDILDLPVEDLDEFTAIAISYAAKRTNYDCPVGLEGKPLGETLRPSRLGPGRVLAVAATYDNDMPSLVVRGNMIYASCSQLFVSCIIHQH